MHHCFCLAKNKPWILMIGFLIFLSTGYPARANTTIQDLQRKIADLSLLKQQLGDRQKQAEEAIEALLNQQNDLLAEVRLLIKSLNIKSLEEAQNHLRLHYDIDLLKTITIYLNEFEIKIRFFQTGQGKMAYLRQLAEDDTRMISTLNDFQIDALATQISLVINQYLSEALSIQIDLSKIETASDQHIWDNIINARP